MTELALPRALNLPRVKFKKPRWPKGNRLFLCCAVIDTVYFVLDCISAAGGPEVLTLLGPKQMGWLDATTPAAFGTFMWWMWWKSRKDNDGPSST